MQVGQKVGTTVDVAAMKIGESPDDKGKRPELPEMPGPSPSLPQTPDYPLNFVARQATEETADIKKQKDTKLAPRKSEPLRFTDSPEVDDRAESASDKPIKPIALSAGTKIVIGSALLAAAGGCGAVYGTLMNTSPYWNLMLIPLVLFAGFGILFVVTGARNYATQSLA